MQTAFQKVVIFYHSCSWSRKVRENWDGTTEKAEELEHVGEPLGMLWLLREVNLVLCSAAELQ